MLTLNKLLPLSPIVLAIALAACSDKQVTPAATEAPAAIQPAAAATIAPPSIPKPDAATLAKGEAIYNQTCQACHAAGVVGAPKMGDKNAWAAHLAKGIDTLHTNALNGFAMMPARGGNAMLKDADVQAAVDFMVSKVN